LRAFLSQEPEPNINDAVTLVFRVSIPSGGVVGACHELQRSWLPVKSNTVKQHESTQSRRSLSRRFFCLFTPVSLLPPPPSPPNHTASARRLGNRLQNLLAAIIQKILVMWTDPPLDPSARPEPSMEINQELRESTTPEFRDGCLGPLGDLVCVQEYLWRGGRRAVNRKEPHTHNVPPNRSPELQRRLLWIEGEARVDVLHTHLFPTRKFSQVRLFLTWCLVSLFPLPARSKQAILPTGRGCAKHIPLRRKAPPSNELRELESPFRSGRPVS
jgi:hypothetical protein